MENLERKRSQTTENATKAERDKLLRWCVRHAADIIPHWRPVDWDDCPITQEDTQKQADAIRFVEMLWGSDVPRVCIENPVGVLSARSKMGKATQYIQPWQFGHGETKKTGLWLRGLPPLKPTNIVEGREGRVWKIRYQMGSCVTNVVTECIPEVRKQNLECSG